MPRVKCPHCGAGNQDATEKDICWQCGNVLGAPVTRAQAPPRPAMTHLSAPTQQLDPNLLSDLPPSGRSATGSSPRGLAIALAVTVVIIVVLILVLFFVLSGHK